MKPTARSAKDNICYFGSTGQKQPWEHALSKGAPRLVENCQNGCSLNNPSFLDICWEEKGKKDCGQSAPVLQSFFDLLGYGIQTMRYNKLQIAITGTMN